MRGSLFNYPHSHTCRPQCKLSVFSVLPLSTDEALAPVLRAACSLHCARLPLRPPCGARQQPPGSVRPGTAQASLCLSCGEVMIATRCVCVCGCVSLCMCVCVFVSVFISVCFAIDKCLINCTNDSLSLTTSTTTFNYKK